MKYKLSNMIGLSKKQKEKPGEYNSSEQGGEIRVKSKDLRYKE